MIWRYPNGVVELVILEAINLCLNEAGIHLYTMTGYIDVVTHQCINGQLRLKTVDAYSSISLEGDMLRVHTLVAKDYTLVLEHNINDPAMIDKLVAVIKQIHPDYVKLQHTIRRRPL